MARMMDAIRGFLRSLEQPKHVVPIFKELKNGVTHKRVPYPYQMEGVEKAEKFKGRVLLADSMGLGKTLQFLLYCLRHPEAMPAVVVCPAHLKKNWQNECAMVGLYSEILDGMKGRSNGLGTHKGVYITNYEVLGAWTYYLREFVNPGIIAVDEAHRIGNWKTQAYKNVRDLQKGVKRLFVITGTPIQNNVVELWSLVNLLRPDIFNSFPEFSMMFCPPTKVFGRKVYKTSDNLRLLNHRLKRTCMIRRLKEEVLEQLPSKTNVVVPLPIEGRKEYELAKSDFKRWLRTHNPEKATTSDRFESLVKVGYLLRLTSKLKMKSMVSWINSFLQEDPGKLIAFGVNRELCLDPLHQTFPNLSVLVHGKVPSRAREIAQERFWHDPKCRIFFGQIKAVGTGWNGQIANTVAHLQLHWNPAVHDQATDRAHRIGQKKAVTAYWLIAVGTVEEDLCEILQRKAKESSEALDGNFITSKLNIYTELLRVLQQKGW